MEVSSRIQSVSVPSCAPSSSGAIVVVPTYNERENIEAFLERVGREGVDVMIVDDASPDGTAEVVVRIAAQATYRLFLMRRTHKFGLGTAYADAFSWLLEHEPNYKVMVQMDADFSHDPAALPALIQAGLETGVGTGSRYVKGGVIPDWSWHRRALSFWGNVYARFVLRLFLPGYAVHDNTAGFMAWRRDVLQKLLPAEALGNGYAFQISMKAMAIGHGFHIQELPIVFRDRTRGQSKMHQGIITEAIFIPWRIGWRLRKMG